MIRIAASGPTPALALRPWAPEDIPALIKAHADPAMRRWLMRHIADEGQALAALADQQRDWDAGTRFTFAVLRAVAVDADNGDVDNAGVDNEGRAAGEPIGSVSIRRLAKDPDAAEVGYWTAAEARGKSVALRAVEGVLAWSESAWSEDPVSRFNLIHTLGNDASCRVAIKLGFKLAEDLPAYPPKFPEPGHLHVRQR